jgi:type I restriction enzyme, S subunit
MSQLFGWEGALALSGEAFAGRYVSPQFPTFRVIDERLDRAFLGWWLQRPSVWEQLKQRAKGMGDRRRTLNPEALLGLEIALPAVTEQRVVVRKIDAIAARLAAARRLRQEIQNDFSALLVAMSHRNDLSPDEKRKDGWQHVALGEFLRQSAEEVAVVPGQTYPHFGIYSFAKGLFRKADLSGDEVKAPRLYPVSYGQFIYGRLNAYEGAFGMVSKEFDGSHVSSEFPAFDCDQDRVLPEFLLAYFSAPAVWETLKRQVTGIGGGAGNRRIRLKEQVFLAHRLWLPPIDYQQRIQAVASRLGDAQAVRAGTDAEFDALLPAVLDKAFKGEL